MAVDAALAGGPAAAGGGGGGGFEGVGGSTATAADQADLGDSGHGTQSRDDAEEEKVELSRMTEWYMFQVSPVLSLILSVCPETDRD